MLCDARIRLEGQLEVVESATRALSSAETLGALRHAVGLDASGRLQRAERSVARMAEHEPELGATLRGLTAARRRFERRVFARAHRLGIAVDGLERTVELLAADPVEYEATLANTVEQLALTACAGFAIVMALWSAHPAPLIIAVPAVVMALIGRARVVLTRQRLILVSSPVALDEIRRVRLETTFSRGPLPIRMIVELFDGQRLEARLPCKPRQLMRLLEARGIDVHDNVPWWSLAG